MIVSGWVSMVTMISSFSCVTPEGQCSTLLRTAPAQPAQHTRPDCSTTIVHALTLLINIIMHLCVRVRVCVRSCVYVCIEDVQNVWDGVAFCFTPYHCYHGEIHKRWNPSWC